MCEATNTSHLEKVERGYENMDHYSVDFKKERVALSAINFITGNRVFCSWSSCPVVLDKLREVEDQVAGPEIRVFSVFFSHNLSADEDEEEEEEEAVGAEKNVHKEQATSGGTISGLLNSQPASLPLLSNPVKTPGS